MKKIIYILAFLLLTSLSSNIYANEDEGSCNNTVFSDVFTCADKSVYSYCSSASKMKRSLESASGEIKKINIDSFNLYESAYCDLENSVINDEIYKNIYEQFKYEYADLKESRVKEVLENQEKTNQYLRFKKAYDAEKAIVQTKTILKNKLAKKEIWYDGSLSDSPFDIIVDLNLIDLVLFGSLSKWQDDVWAWPKTNEELNIPDILTNNNDNVVKDDNKDVAENSNESNTDDSINHNDNDNADNSVDNNTDNNALYNCISNDDLTAEDLGNIFNGDSANQNDNNDNAIGEIPDSCGDGNLNENEDCDDGNNLSGDGCSIDCKLEVSNSLSCVDINAVGLHEFSPNTTVSSDPNVEDNTTTVGGEESDETETDSSSPAISCDEGYTAVSTNTNENNEDTPSQNPNYNPYIGGVLKKYKDVKVPECPEGYFAYRVDSKQLKNAEDQIVSGDINIGNSSELGLNILGNKLAIPICIPQNACGKTQGDLDPQINNFRKILFGKDYADDEYLKKLASSIIAYACVDVEKINNAESPYQSNDGCINCHISAMNEILDSALKENLMPSKNNMQAWGMSTKWGPSVTFDIGFMLKDKLKFKHEAKENNFGITEQTKIDQMNLKPQSKLPISRDNINLGNFLKTQSDYVQERSDKEKDEMEYKRKAISINTEIATNSKLLNYLRQMRDSFGRLQKSAQSLSANINFNTKEECK